MPPIHLDPEDIDRLGPRAQEQVWQAMGRTEKRAALDDADPAATQLRRSRVATGSDGMPAWLVFASAGVVILVLGLAWRAARGGHGSYPVPVAAAPTLPTGAEPTPQAGLVASVTPSATIAAPALVQVEIRDGKQGKSAHISWSPVNGAVGYEVLQLRPGTQDPQFVGGAGASQTEMDVQVDPSLDRVAYSIRAVGPGGVRSVATPSHWVNVPRVQMVSFSRDQRYIGTIGLPMGWENQIADQQGGHWVWGDPQNPGNQVVIDIMGEPEGPPRFRVAELVDPGSNQKPVSPYSIRWASYALQAPGYLWQKQATVGGACSDLGCSQAMVVSVSMPETEANEARKILDSVRGGIAEAYSAKIDRIWLTDVSGRQFNVRTDTLTCINVREQGVLFNLIDDLTGRSVNYRCWEDNNLNGTLDDGDGQYGIETNDARAAAYIRSQSCPEPLTGNVTSVLDGYRIRVQIRLDDEVTTSIIDTGSPMTLFPNSLLERLGYRSDTILPYGVKGVGGGRVSARSYAIRFPHLRIQNEWWLTGPRYDLITVTGAEDQGVTDILLGQDFLARSGIKLEIQNGQWTLKVPCYGRA